MHGSKTRLACAATLSLALLAGCAAPLATAPGPTTVSAPGQAAPAAQGPAAPAAPAATPQPLTWTTLEGQAAFRGEALGHARVHVVDALTNLPAQVIAPGGANVVAPGGLNYRVASVSSAIAVDAATVTTDAEGRFSVQVGGLAPGQPVRLVVEAGDNGLSALVTHSQAQPSGYRVSTTFITPVNEHSSLQAQLVLGATGLSRLQKPELAEKSIAGFIESLRPSQQQISESMANNPSMANELVASIDPKTGSLKKTKEQQALDDRLQRMLEQLDQLLQQSLALQEQEKAKKVKQADEALTKVKQTADEQALNSNLTRDQLIKLLLKSLGAIGAIDPLELKKQAEDAAQKVKDPQGNADDRQRMLAEIDAYIKQKIEEERKKQDEQLRNRMAADVEKQKKEHDQQSELIPSYQDGPARAIVSSSGATSQVQDANQTLLNNVFTSLLQPANVSPALKDQTLNVPKTPVVGLSPGLHLQVTDGAIIVSNAGGQNISFQAGQFGYVPGVNQPPIVIPPNLGVAFVPPPSFSSGSSGPVAAPTPTPLSWSVTALDPTAAAAGAVITTIATNDKPVAIADDGDYAWVPLKVAKKVLCLSVNASSNTDVKAYAVDGVPVGVVTDNGKAYVACDNGKITVLTFSGVQSTVDAGTALTGIAVTNGELILATADQRLLHWAIGTGQGTDTAMNASINVLRRDGLAALSDGRLVTASASVSAAPADLSVSTWLTDATYNWGDVVAGVTSQLFAIDKTSGKVRFGTITGGALTLDATELSAGTPVALAFDGRDSFVKRLFVTDSAGSQVQVFANSGTGYALATPYALGAVPSAILIRSTGDLWVLCPASGKILKLKAALTSA